MLATALVPAEALNLIDGSFIPARAGAWYPKVNPADGQPLGRLARSQAEDIAAAVAAAAAAHRAWATTPAVARGQMLWKVVRLMEDRAGEIAAVVARETGKSPKDARGETSAAIACGQFFAGEGQRLYGRTMTSGVSGRTIMNIRRPLGVAGLIIAANTPIANVAWKVFPSLIAGNAVVLKSAEDAPATAALFSLIAQDAGLPAGVLNVVHGLGTEAGAALVAHQDVAVISFTGSTAVGREIQRVAGERFARVSLELGGKNSLVVCDDADLDLAVKWAVLSSFSNAGQRCAAAGRIIVVEKVYDDFRAKFLAATQALRVGPTDADDLGPVINERSLQRILGALAAAEREGSTILTGGLRLAAGPHAGGFYLAPTILENAAPDAAISCTELFGPVTILYGVPDLAAAVALANRSPYGLTAAIHTRQIDRAMNFAEQIQSGLVSINGGTFGSEPHLSFGGFKHSGNGTREPGVEALDVYSELQHLLINV